MRLKALLPIFLLGSLLSTAHATPGDVSLEQVFPGGTFGQALGLVNAGDGSDRLFVVRQNGIIEVFDDDGNGSPEDFMNISGRLTSGGEQGLLGLAFHPDFDDNGLFYVNYSAGSGHPSGAAQGDTVISEFAIDGTSGMGDPDSERVLLTVVQDFGNHNGGNIKFGPHGYLHIGMGDGGSGGDPCNRSQTLDPDDIQTGGSCVDDPTAAMLGKMLRIDVDNTTPAGDNGLCAADGDGSAEYAVPDDNPFLDDDACAETWTWGLRNPWRFSFDRDTGDMWIADVGQAQWEEVNLELASHEGGANYGWNECEGPFTYPAQNPPEQCTFEHEFPVLHYPISGQPECSITGGYRYRGPVNSLQGLYIFGDYCSGRIWFADEDAQGDWSEEEFSVEGFDLRSFGEDETGNLYVVRDGGIWRFDGDVTDPAPELDSIDPDSGPESGGTEVTLTGENFVDGAQVTFNDTVCATTSVASTEIVCVTPAGDVGPVDVTVTNPDDQSDTLVDGFTYEAEKDPAPELDSVTPDSGPESGGTEVTLTGENFAGTQVTFNGAVCSTTSVEPTEIVCVTPAGDVGPVDVTVTNPDDQSDTLVDGFTYEAEKDPAPELDSLTPNSGPESGGTEVTLAGENFIDGAQVTFNGADCSQISVESSTEITCLTPPGESGPVDVTVTNPDDQSDTLSAGFLYLPDLIFEDRFEELEEALNDF